MAEQPESGKDLAKALERKDKGNTHYKEGRFEPAIRDYSEAIDLCPKAEKKHLAVLYSNRAACAQQFSAFEEAVSDSTLAIENDPQFIKAYQRRYMALEALGRWHEAVKDMDFIMQNDSSQRVQLAGRRDLAAKKADEDLQKQKDEALGQLKNLGNSFLGKFGMTLDNFKTEKQAGGGYNISYNSGGK